MEDTEEEHLSALDLDEYHPKSTRTLFVKNLEKDITAQQLRKIFKPFGEIIVSFVWFRSDTKLEYILTDTVSVNVR